MTKTKTHIVALVLKNAIQEKRICPITHDPITESSTCIAPCYHSFDTEAIDTWLQTHTTCPECREVCV
jgi:SUMO ligase MMS21 Smc5/6 complex component